MINMTEQEMKDRKIFLNCTGENNSVFIHPQVEIKGKLIIKITGNGNNVYIDRGCNVIGYSINLKGSNNNISIGIRSRLNGLISCKSDGNTVKIGRFCTLVGVRIEVEYGQSVEIEDDCIFSRNVSIRTGDSHAIVSMVTKERLNMPKSIKIGKHCWLGFGVNVGKGVELQGNTIVGACSYVAKTINEGNCIIAGSPAKIVKRDTIWDRRSLPRTPDVRHIDNMIESYAWK